MTLLTRFFRRIYFTQNVSSRIVPRRPYTSNFLAILYFLLQAIHRVCLVVHFPVDYPDENSPPTFVFAKGTTLDPQARSYILKALRQTAAEKVKQKSPCLNPCLRQLETLLAELPQNSSGKFICTHGNKILYTIFIKYYI